jgi:murein DD-endopeptidase MepM/ murein hydrolase activator NlpD
MRVRRVANARASAIGTALSAMTLAAGFAATPLGWAQTVEADPVVAGNALLASRNLAMPVDGVASATLRDTFSDSRNGHRHEAIDIAAPRGAKVFAVDDGRLVKLFTSVPGGLTVYQFDPHGRLAYYYAHLDRYADGLREGMTLHRCDLLGYVGASGNAASGSPHLHFAVFRLDAEHRWWKGVPINPYWALTRTASRNATSDVPASGRPRPAPVSASVIARRQEGVRLISPRTGVWATRKHKTDGLA